MLKNNQTGYTTLDVIFIIVMPALIILAIISAYSKANINESAPPDPSRFSRVEPTVSDFWEINIDVDYGSSVGEGAYSEGLFFVDSGRVVYSEDNISSTNFKIDTTRNQAKIEFYTAMASELSDAGFAFMAGADIVSASKDSDSEFAALYLQENVNRMCLVYNPSIDDISQLTCADVADSSSESIPRSFSDFSDLVGEQQVYVHDSYSSRYFGSEPDQEQSYEYAIGGIYTFRLLNEVPVVDELSSTKVVFWRQDSSADWNPYIDYDYGSSSVTTECKSIKQINALALPNEVCLDDDGNYRLLGDYYAK